MKKIIQVLSTVLILALLTSCGYNYSKEYDKLYEASNSGTSFSNLKGQYETFKSKLVEKYEELARKSRDLTTKGQKLHHGFMNGRAGLGLQSLYILRMIRYLMSDSGLELIQ